MGYFPNASAWDEWANGNCFKCRHWPVDDDAPGCPIDMLHNLYNYDQCEDDRLGSILSTLIPQDGIKTLACAMFIEGTVETEAVQNEREVRRKYEAALAEMRASR